MPTSNYTYLIIGAGMTAAAAIAGIRELDPTGSIGVIGAESQPPYDRPVLSKGLWKDKTLDSIWCKINPKSVTFHLGRTAKQLNPAAHLITDDQGASFTYTKLLLATGCTPRRLPFGGDQIIYFRTLDDYNRLRALTQHADHFAVIGGGFIGTEIAAALAMNGKKVSLIFPDQSIGARLYPPDLSSFLSDYFRQKGVELFPNATVTACDTSQNKSTLTFRDTRSSTDRHLIADAVVAGIGVQPDVALAQSAGITIDNGIRVDSSLRTNYPDIFAAGDVANFHNPALDQWLRVEHEDNATTMGAFAGAAMAGRNASYDHLPFFYSDLFEVGYEAIGEVDPRLQIIADWKTPLKEGVIYYLRAGRVRGVLLWNLLGHVDAARQVIAAPGPFTAANLKNRITA